MRLTSIESSFYIHVTFTAIVPVAYGTQFETKMCKKCDKMAGELLNLRVE